MENALFNIAYAAYTASTLLYLIYLFTKRERFSRLAWGFLCAALLAHIGSSAALGIQQAGNSYVPWSNWFESFSFFGAIIALIYFFIGWRIPIPLLGVFIMPVSWGLLTVAFFSDKTIHPLAPAPDNYWAAIHVPLAFVSYSILGVAFAVGVAYLLEERQMKSKRPGALAYRLPSLEELDGLIHKLIMAALPPLTLGIFLGGVWAYAAWGRFWGWDPKETWALMTWFIYVVYLLLRLFAGWRGRKTAYLSLAGFVLVMFTYVGVNYLSPLHGFLSASAR